MILRPPDFFAYNYCPKVTTISSIHRLVRVEHHLRRFNRLDLPVGLYSFRIESMEALDNVDGILTAQGSVESVRSNESVPKATRRPLHNK